MGNGWIHQNIIAMRESRLVRKPGVVRLWLKAEESYEISLLGVTVSYVLSSSTCSISKCARDVIVLKKKKRTRPTLVFASFLSFFTSCVTRIYFSISYLHLFLEVSYLQQRQHFLGGRDIG